MNSRFSFMRNNVFWHNLSFLNSKPLSSQRNTQPCSQIVQIIELCSEYLSARCIWLYVIIMSRTSFRVDAHSIVCLNVNKLPARSRRHIWSLSNSNEIRTRNHLVLKQTLNHLAKLAKCLSCVESTYLYGTFDCMLLSCRVRISE